MSMTLLSSSRREAIRLIREQLRCALCGNIFQDPQCLDCKHNFCRPCIFLHLKKHRPHCPNCQLPIRPSEVTRNQFLESILAAWKTVETELEALNGDPTLHETKFTMEDTDRALRRAVTGSNVVTMSESSQQNHTTRGRVANNKWHINTQEIRHELKLEQLYLPQHYGPRQTESTAHWKKTSSSDLPDSYGGSASARRDDESNEHERSRKKGKKLPLMSLDRASAMGSEEATRRIHCRKEEDEKETACGFLSPSTDDLMATQEVKSYMDRITKQREALSRWEKTLQQESDGKSSLLDLERSLHSSNRFDELLKERRRKSQHFDDGDDSLTQLTQMTQLPPSTNSFESPLTSFRRRRHVDHIENDSDRQLKTKAKGRILPASPPPLHPKSWIPSQSRKRLRTLSPMSNHSTRGHNAKPAIDTSQRDPDKDDQGEVPNNQPTTIRSKEEAKENGDEEEYEMKPAVPLPPTPEHKSSSCDRHCKRLSSRQSAITASQSENKHGNSSTNYLSAKKLLSCATPAKIQAGAGKEDETARLHSSGSLSTSPMHISTSNAKPSQGGLSFVFVSSDLTRDEAKRVLEATQRLGGKFGHDFDLKRDPVTGHFCTSVTHLITKAVPPIGAIRDAEPSELRCKRTAKYMRALAEGTYVMDFSWITASLSARRWLTEEPFEIIGDIYSDAVGKPHEGRIRHMQTGRRNSIFGMFSFVLLVSEKEFDFQFNSVQTLVNNFGGTIVYGESFTKLKNKRKQRSRRSPVGVVSKSTSPSDAKAKWQQFQIPVVRITWIFDSVSHLEVLPFDDYYPY